MAARGLFNATDLEPLLAERGISLSSVQVWRLVTQVPERLSLTVLSALCDILEASPADLIITTADSAAGLPKAAAANAPADPGAMRPRRATLKPQPG
jgi:DNA-binding Xre family transcriptional regulator